MLTEPIAHHAGVSPDRRTEPISVAAISRAVSRGDPEALGVLYEHWFGFCLRAAGVLTRRDESFCLDVVQDVFLRIAKALPPLDSEAQLAAYLRRTVHATCLDHLRAERRRRLREAAAAQSDTPHPSLDERIDWLAARLDELAESDRELLDHRFGRGATLGQTAHAVGRSFDAVHARLKRLLTSLRARRESDHD